MVEETVIMTRNAESAGMTLVEMLVVIAIMAILAAIAGPEIYKALQSESRVKSAARELIADLKTAQNEAVRRGGGEMSADGVLVRRSVFVVFDAAANTYLVSAYADENGNGVRDGGEDTTIMQPKTPSNSVRFGTLASVNKTACTNSENNAPASSVTFDVQAAVPCGGKRCVELNANGFPGAPGGTLYLSNTTDAYAVNFNSAGFATLCKWSGSAWAIVR